MTAKRYRVPPPRPPRLRPSEPVAVSSGRPAQSWRHVVGAAIGATALFLVLLLTVALFGDASTHGGVFPSATQGKIYRAH
jgi:hypothetical protein